MPFSISCFSTVSYTHLFFVCLLSVAIQGSLLPLLSRRLGLIEKDCNVFRTFNDYQDAKELNLIEVRLSEGHPWVGQTLQPVSYTHLSPMLSGRQRPKYSAIVAIRSHRHTSSVQTAPFLIMAGHCMIRGILWPPSYMSAFVPLKT